MEIYGGSKREGRGEKRANRREEKRDAHATTHGSLAVNLTGVYLNLRSRLWPAACTGIMYGRMNMHRTRYELRSPPPRATTLCSLSPTEARRLLTLRFHDPPTSPPPCVLFNTRFKARHVDCEGEEEKKEGEERKRNLEETGRFER